MAKILIVGGPRDYQSAGIILRKGGHDPTSATNMKDALEQAKMLPFGSLILSNFRIGDYEAPEFITALRERHINHPVIVYGTNLSSADVCKAMNGHKAIDYVQEPAFDKELMEKVNKHLPKIGCSKCDPTSPYPRFGSTYVSKMENLDKIAAYDTSVMIVGEPGLGKERIAREIHKKSNRADKPLVIISHPDFITETLSETPCPACHIRSCFERANGGTIIIKNLHSFCPRGQALIITAIESGDYNVRVIVTADTSIRQLVSDGDISHSLIHFADTCVVEVPTLRDCTEDIEVLANFFLMEFAESHNQPVCKLTEGALSTLNGYNWPRNAKELRSAMTQCASVSTTGRITISNLHNDCFTDFKKPTTPLVKMEEESRIMYAIKHTRTLKEAAEMLGMCEKTLLNKRKLYGLDENGDKKVSV